MTIACMYVIYILYIYSETMHYDDPPFTIIHLTFLLGDREGPSDSLLPAPEAPPPQGPPGPGGDGKPGVSGLLL